MKVLVVGGGGREHALAWKAAQSDAVSKVLVAPGNAGTAGEAKVENAAVSADDVNALVELAVSSQIDLTIVGPEAPLVAGLVDRLQAAGQRVFGPNRRAAEIEASKAFTKAFLSRHQIPTADYGVFTELETAFDYIDARGAPIVVKADGLAAGKGVVVAATVEQAKQAATSMLGEKLYGDAGSRLVIEQCLQGEEVSFIAVVAGEEVVALATSQDHKAAADGDRGPNTGGMGAYSPAPVVDATVHQRILSEVIEPTVRGLSAEDRPYTGFLYAGLMIDAAGNPRVLEYNCRGGDPETQPIMMRLRTDLVALCEAAIDGRPGQVGADWDERVALGVVMASKGYPGPYPKDDPIEALSPGLLPDSPLRQPADPDRTKVFHAGTRLDGGTVVSAGGRVLCVCALGDTVGEAQRLAYQRVDEIAWSNAYFRRDIGYRAIARESG